MKSLLLLAVAAASPGGEASIPDMNRADAIIRFQAAASDLLYLQHREGRWYRARLTRRCPGLKKAKALAFDLGASSTSLSLSGAILTREARCPIDSLTYSDPPPNAKKARKPLR